MKAQMAVSLMALIPSVALAQETRIKCQLQTQNSTNGGPFQQSSVTRYYILDDERSMLFLYDKDSGNRQKPCDENCVLSYGYGTISYSYEFRGRFTDATATLEINRLSGKLVHRDNFSSGPTKTIFLAEGQCDPAPITPSLTPHRF